ncbi:MAG: bifunctional folylpolyglutamate synthase/dihydrofolate synthase [Elusimicrobia bacterium]|nr:bifunctional folylpolyglutamate synthase/dihydrofolate synthase [Elusimicrobiota bacterium]
MNRRVCYNKKISSFKDAIRYLESLAWLGVKFELARIAKVLKVFGDPPDRLKVIHVAGTNGKGSVCAFLSSILQGAGYKVGLYTSPHLTDVVERVQISRWNINRKVLAEIIGEVKRVSESLRIKLTYFELLTAVAFIYFDREKVDIAIIETGMGGRLDATNVIRNPLVSVITNVDYDHTEYLGNALTRIASEKAAIIKDHGIVVTAVTQPEVLAVIKAQCRKNKANLVRADKSIKIPAGWTIGLKGSHQKINAACALGAVKQLQFQGIKVSEKAIRQGLAKAFWPGRLEIFKLATSDQRPVTVVLDGAHNPAGTRTLVKNLQSDIFSYNKLLCVFGILKDKNYQAMIGQLGPLIDLVILTQPRSERALAIEKMLPLWRAYIAKDNIYQEATVKQALKKALTLAGQRDLICITGSLYTVGEARKILLSEHSKK